MMEVATKRRPNRDRRPRRRIPTGAPRLVESSADRLQRQHIETWTEFVAAIRRSCAARLELLRGRASDELICCPWARIFLCDDGCRCGGSGSVTVGFLRDHYACLAGQVAKIARVSS